MTGLKMKKKFHSLIWTFVAVVYLVDLRMATMATTASKMESRPSHKGHSPEKDKNGHDEFLYGTFPAGFKWGLGSAAYQVEGAWNESGKGASIWDVYAHQDPSPIAGGGTGDVTCDSYHRFDQDVAALKSIGAQQYRFSISWPRILPKGTGAGVNQAGIEYYNNLINALLTEGIEPFVTIHHWDLPQALQDIGGWSNPQLVDHFVNYASLLFTEYGDRVKNWVTFNGPWVICWLGYSGVYAPGLNEPETRPYKCGYTILKAHALTYHMYHREFNGSHDGRGRIGIAFDVKWYEPATDSPEDAAASERSLQFKMGWFMGPLVYGRYPDIMSQLIDAKSEQEGRPTSRLPELEPEWTRLIKGSWDFIGLSHYTTDLVSSIDPEMNPQAPGWQGDQNTHQFQDPTWTETGSFWLKVTPWGFCKLLNWIRVEYGNPEIVITENGMSDAPQDGNNEKLEDTTRSNYYWCYINSMLKAVVLDGCNVTGYIAWTLMDNFEWRAGFTEKFGVFHVNYSDPSLPRTPKASAAVLAQIFKDNGFPEPSTSSGPSRTKSASFYVHTLSFALMLIMAGIFGMFILS